MSDRRVLCHKFGPRAVAVGHFLAYGDVPGDTADFLEENNRRWPGLSFRDFWGGYVLAESLTWKIEGKA
jgi:hypothetical protein